MDKRNGNPYRLWLAALLCLAALALAVGVSVAIYTNQGFKKGVATTTQTVARFSSNRLDQIPESELSEPDKFTQHSVTATTLQADVTKVSFDFSIYNYAPGMPTLFNSGDIQYNLWLQVVPQEGTTITSANYTVGDVAFTSGIFELQEEVLQRGSANSNHYTVTMPKDDLNKVSFQVVATATDAYKSAVNSIALAAILTPMQITGGTTTTKWSGHWVEAELTSPPEPRDCAVFNYEMNGTAEGTVTLTWPACFQIDPYFVAGLCAADSSISVETNADGTQTLTFPVDGAEQSVYKIRFYRTETALAGDYSEDSFTTWPDVLTNFVPKPEEPTTEP